MYPAFELSSVDIMTLSRKYPKPRFSLLALLIAVTVISLWLGRVTFHVSHQEKAVNTITTSEGIVRMDQEGPPNCIQKAIGIEYFQNVESVGFATNKGRKKGTNDPKVTDELLAQLVHLTDTKILELSHNETVTDEELFYLRPLKNLEAIYLFRTQIKGPGLTHLTGLTHLNYLDLNRNPLTDIGLEYIAKIKELKWLGLNNTRVTDTGIAYLSKLKNLKSLSLNNTDITDKSLDHLQKIKSLLGLRLRGTKITAEGINKIVQALPDCEVGYSFPLGKTADELPLFPAGYAPSEEELVTKFKSRGIGGDVQSEKTEIGNQIIELSLYHTALSEKVILDLIKTMPHLRKLKLWGSLVGDRFLEKLKEAKSIESIEHLEISDSNVTDACLQYLKSFASLRKIDFDMNAITNEGLENFPLLSGIEQISFENTRVTPEAAKNLEERLPGCRVEY